MPTLSRELEAALEAIRAEVGRQTGKGRQPEREPEGGIPRERPVPEAPPQVPPQPIPPWQREAQMPMGRPIPQFQAPLEQKPIQPILRLPEPKKEPVSVPFWMRALQVFTAPFEWVDENVIIPGLAIAGTAAGLVPEVARKPGEDFFEWKKRSWAELEVPGIDLNVPWDDKPWRLDIKGILAFAPWLLLPGVGQVGGAAGLGARLAGKAGTRLARGLAGRIATKQLGLPGRILGSAVEYSPWGLVEKTAGVALRGGIRATGKISERVSTAVGERIFGKYAPPPPTLAEIKVTKFFKESIAPARLKFEEAVPRLRAQQEAIAAKAFDRARKGEITFEVAEKQATKALGKVEGIRKGFGVKATDITKREVNEIVQKIDQAAEYGLMDLKLIRSMKRSLMGLDLPEPAQLKAFARIFGKDFAEAVSKVKGAGLSSWEKTVDALNFPRAILASSDLSATFRQGLILGLLHPTQTPRWFGRQLKAFLSEKMAFEMDDALRARPNFKEFVKAGGYIAPIRDALPTAAEELFMSNMARRVPLVRRSERAFITYLNEARMASFDAAHGAMTAQQDSIMKALVARGAKKVEIDKAVSKFKSDKKLMAEFINLASGRGTLPKGLDKYNPVFNTVLFSPKLQAATLQLPRQLGRMLLSKNPYMRKEAAKAFITFVGGGSALLGLIKATGGEVELDPRAGAFGKIKIGDTHLDIWRGYVQYARFAAQMLTGERKSAYGNLSKAERGEIASRFLQSKSSPAFGLLVDLMRGETYMGKPIFDDTTGFSRAAMERVVPLALQDVIDATEQSGVNGLWVAAPAMLGVGVLTYVNDLVRVKAKIAKTAGYDSWDDMDPKTQREIQNSNAELQAAYIDFDRQVMGTAWGDWRNAGNAVEDVFKENVDRAVAQYQQTGDGVLFRDKISKAFTARKGGYAAREKEDRFEDIVKRQNIEDTLESTIALGPEQMAIKIYNDALYNDDMHDEFGDYRFDEAEIIKQQLRTQLDAMQPGLFDYVEEYRGLKYELMPAEFQELIKAKIVMREYWQVRDWYIKVIRQGREPRTESAIRLMDAFVARRRKSLRLTNPEIAKYYDQFYKKQ